MKNTANENASFNIPGFDFKLSLTKKSNEARNFMREVLSMWLKTQKEQDIRQVTSCICEIQSRS